MKHNHQRYYRPLAAAPGYGRGGAGRRRRVRRGAVPASRGGLVDLPGANVAAFGPNVCVFNDTMSQATIQADLNNIASQQVSNQFGTQRFAIFFEPGTYGSTTDPLIFTVGYYTSVAGLGLNPGGVVINGQINVYNQCSSGSCTALDNFWRSVSNLTINVTGDTRRDQLLRKRGVLGGVAGLADAASPRQRQRVPD